MESWSSGRRQYSKQCKYRAEEVKIEIELKVHQNILSWRELDHGTVQDIDIHLIIFTSQSSWQLGI